MFHAISLAKVEQGSDVWRAARKHGIGGSDASAALGLDDYNSEYARTPLDLYKEKLNIVPDSFDENWFSRRGKALEPVLRLDYAERTGRVVRVPEHILQHPVHKFMIASLDGFSDDGRIQEFKTASSNKGWGTEGTDEIPQKYLVQVQHNLIVTGAEYADVCVSVGGMKPKQYEVKADQELQNMIIEGEAAFWNKVENKVEPDPATIEEMRRKFIIHEGVSAVADAEIYRIVCGLNELKAIEKEAGENFSAYKEVVQKFLLENGASILVDAAFVPLVTWNEGKGRTTLDTKALKAERPEIYEGYSKTGLPVRTFLLK